MLINSREFTLPELKLLVDAVEASPFITKTRCAVQRNIFARRMKSDNEKIFDVSEQAPSCREAAKTNNFLV